MPGSRPPVLADVAVVVELPRDEIDPDRAPRPAASTTAAAAALTCRTRIAGVRRRGNEMTLSRATDCDRRVERLEGRRAKVARQLSRLLLEAGARDARPEMGAQRRAFELRQLPVEAERDPQTGTLALGTSKGSHSEFDGRGRQELGELTGQPASASAPATISRISWVICACRARFIWSV